VPERLHVPELIGTGACFTHQAEAAMQQATRLHQATLLRNIGTYVPIPRARKEKQEKKAAGAQEALPLLRLARTGRRRGGRG
jgi:hypothetical protein